MSESLQTELDAIEPTLNELAGQLGIAPETVLREAVEMKKKEWAYQQLDTAVAEAKASGFTPFVPGQLAHEVQERVAIRKSERPIH